MTYRLARRDRDTMEVLPGISIERLNKTKENPGKGNTNAVVGVPARKPPCHKACAQLLYQPV